MAARARRRSAPKRTRTRNMVIRLSDAERAMLDRVAKRSGLTCADVIRFLVRRADEAKTLIAQ